MSRPGKYIRVGGSALAGLSCVIWPLAGPAQQTEDGGALATFTFSERLQWEDGDTFLRSGLGFALSSQTRNQSLFLSLDGALEHGDRRSDDLVDPRVRLSYGIESRATALSFDLNYRQADVDSFALEDPLDETTLVLQDGTRTDSTARVGLEFGRDAPFGGNLEVNHRTTEYSDTASPGLVDSTFNSADLTLRFDIDRRISARVTTGISETDRDGGTDLRRETLGVGATFAVTQSLEAGLDIGTTRVEQSGTVPLSVNEGTFLRFSLAQERPNGVITGSIVSDIDENGRRNTARVGRELDLPRGRLRANLGLAEDDETGDINPVYDLFYLHELPRGALSLSMEQSFGSDTLGNEVLNSRFRVAYEQELTSLSRFDAALSLRQSEVTGGNDTEQIDLNLNYSHLLTQDWSVIGGYTHSRRTVGGGNDETDDTVFVGLRTSFGWRP